VTSIAVLDYGSGNLHSVSRAIAAVGGDPLVTADPHRVADADALVIPGVGHVGACMRAIRRHGLDRVVKDYVGTGRPVFGVCVGMQVLYDGSDEDPDPCLGVLPGRSTRLPDEVTVPHMGWNTISWTRDHPYVADLPEGIRFYFVHSYAPPVDDLTVGITEHGRAFSAAVTKENVFATQFHPEKSGDAGLAIYERFVKAVAA
jgi:imidazole glycerol-phosphate synthase subunit HisH